MNIDANVQKVFSALVKKWKLIIIFAIIGAVLAGIATAKFTKLSYTSTIEFLAYVNDSDQELAESTATAQSGSAHEATNAQQASQTSKMNYAMKMLDTYIEIFSTNEFYQDVADELNKTYGTNYPAATIKNSTKVESIDNTAMFEFTTTTNDADLSYHITQSLEKCVPEKMKGTNKGLVLASVEDPPIRATAAESMDYPKKCLIGAAAGIFLAGLYAVLKDLLDVRIKGSADLEGKYDIPVLGAVPEFYLNKSKKEAGRNGKK